MKRFFRNTILASILSFVSVSAFAQGAPTSGSVSGKLTDAQNSPVSYATVSLLRADSSLVGGDLSKEDGTFHITGTGTGSFTLRIEVLGMKGKRVPVEITADAPDKNMGTIKIATSATTLKEVNVVGEKALMEMHVDKKVFNVEKNITAAGGSAADVLSNVPSVSVDADGNVSLRGKSDVTILIDGKPATLLGSDVASALKSMPASSIENVEVITNPSAKYDAQGMTGIINITTKKDQRFGINGSATAGVGTNDKYNGSFSLNIHKGKWNAFLNSSYRVNNSFNNVTTDRHDNYADSAGAKQSYHTYEHVPRHFDGFFNTIGATYDPNKYNSITLTENLNSMHFSFKDYSDYRIFTTSAEQDPNYYQNRYTNSYGGFTSASTSLDYKHKFKKKDEELSVDGTFALNHAQRTQDYTTGIYGYTPAGEPTQQFLIDEHAPGGGYNTSVNIWADYTDPLFTKNGKLGLGFKSQFYWFNSSNTPIIDTMGRGQRVDTALLAHYDYTQQIHAGYINWSDQVGKFSYQVGLRVEDASYDGSNNATSPSTNFSNTFVDLFPSAFISYQLPAQQSIYLNYSRRTNRPNFFQLLPYKDISNPSTVNQGNPNLIPEFIHNIEFSYNKQDNKGNNIILSTYYQYTQNLIDRVNTLITDSTNPYVGRQLIMPLNLASGTTYGVEATAHLQFTKMWDATVNANFFENQIKIGNVDAATAQYLSDNSGFNWIGKINTNYKLPLGLALQINANYESPKTIAQGKLKEVYWVDIALRKNLLNNKATIVLNCNDIFISHSTTTDYSLPEYNETVLREREGRVFNLSFTYRFGKSDFGNKPGAGKGNKKNTTAPKPDNEERENNLKSGDDDNGGGGGQGGGGGNKGSKGQ